MRWRKVVHGLKDFSYGIAIIACEIPINVQIIGSTTLNTTPSEIEAMLILSVAADTILTFNVVLPMISTFIGISHAIIAIPYEKSFKPCTTFLHLMEFLISSLEFL